MNWKIIVGTGAALILIAAGIRFILLPRLTVMPEFDPGTPHFRPAAPLHPKYWVGADLVPSAMAAFERIDVAPGAQQDAMLGAAVATKVRAMLAQGYDCDTAGLKVYSRSGRPKQLLRTDCRHVVAARLQQDAPKNNYPVLLVLEGETLHEVKGLEAFGFMYDSGELVGVTDLGRSGQLELWLSGTVSDCEGTADCDAHGSVVVAETAEGLKKQEYTMDASCPEIRNREDDGKKACVCGPGLAPYRDLLPARHSGMDLAAMCGYAETDDASGEPVVSGIVYYSGFTQIPGVVLRERNVDGGEIISFADTTRQDAIAKLKFDPRPVELKGDAASSEDPCLSAPADLGLRLLKIVMGSGNEVAFAVKYTLGRVGTFNECGEAAER